MENLSKSSKKLALSHAQLESLVLQRTLALQVLSQRLLKVQDEERRRVARDLHDSTGQTLAALKISVALLKDKVKGNSVISAMASEIDAFADQAIEEVRTTSYLLHPPLLDEVGFACAAEWFVEGFAKRSGIKVKSKLAKERQRLPITIETALFRVLQESLTNVHRHSGALEVSIVYQLQAENVILEINDCGHGIGKERLELLRGASAETGVGLAGMRERLSELNGTLEIDSDAHGTRMRASIPLIAPAEPVQYIDYRQEGRAEANCA
ncbi:MAG TPA: sensor histidine kinase [Candidatus Sulfotelmatobacter sp.]